MLTAPAEKHTPAPGKVFSLLKEGRWTDDADGLGTLFSCIRNRPGIHYPIQTEIYSDAARYDLARADAILENRFTAYGDTAQLGGNIWTAQPQVEARDEWVGYLHRHFCLVDLVEAFRETEHTKYLDKAEEILTSWRGHFPVPDEKRIRQVEKEWGPWAMGGMRPAWSTINAGIRLRCWLALFYRMLRYGILKRSLLAHLLEGFAEHGNFLVRMHGNANWLAIETSSLYSLAVTLPEFREAAKWKREALRRLDEAMKRQVYPDGGQVELSTWYHMVALKMFARMLEVGQACGETFSAEVMAKIEGMFEFIGLLSEPQGVLPRLNDADDVDLRSVLEVGTRLFPQREDFVYWATSGRTGGAPDRTDVHLPHSGYLVLRDKWGRDGNYCLLDGGPFGFGHQHEDKLNLVITHRGERFVEDSGRFAYVKPGETLYPFRKYCLSTAAHNTLMVDGRGQDRRTGHKWTEAMLQQQAPCLQGGKAGFTWMAAAFGTQPGEVYEGLPEGACVHTRRVFWLKGAGWLVVDRVDGADAGEHQVTGHFHLARVKAVRRVGGIELQGERGSLHAHFAGTAQTGIRILEGQTQPYLCGFRLRNVAETPAPAPVIAVESTGSWPVVQASFWQIGGAAGAVSLVADAEAVQLQLEAGAAGGAGTAFALTWTRPGCEDCVVSHGSKRHRWQILWP